MQQPGAEQKHEGRDHGPGNKRQDEAKAGFDDKLTGLL